MPFRIIKSGMMTLLFCSIIVFSVSTAGARDFTDYPQLKQGQKIRVGYLEGGPFLNYHHNLVAFVNGLVTPKVIIWSLSKTGFTVTAGTKNCGQKRGKRF